MLAHFSTYLMLQISTMLLEFKCMHLFVFIFFSLPNKKNQQNLFRGSSGGKYRLPVMVFLQVHMDITILWPPHSKFVEACP